MSKNLTPKRVAEVIEIAKEQGVKSGAYEMNGQRFEFNFVASKSNSTNEWDDTLDAN